MKQTLLKLIVALAVFGFLAVVLFSGNRHSIGAVHKPRTDLTAINSVDPSPPYLRNPRLTH